MQRFRLLPAVVTISLTFSAVLANADQDTPAQAAARAALMQQMNQTDQEQMPGSSNSLTEPAPANPPPAAAQPPAAQPPMAQPTPQFSTNVPVMTPPESGPAGMAGTNSMPQANVTPEPNGMPETKEMPEMKAMPRANEPAATQAKVPANATAISVPPPSVLTNDSAQYPVNPPLTPLPPSQADSSAPTPAPTPAIVDQMHPAASGPGLSNPGAMDTTGPGANLSRETQGTNSVSLQDAPLNAPPLPITPEKQAELQNALSRYMANQLTPVQYQEERARIMAEP